MFNKVVLVGFLTRNNKLKYLQNGTALSQNAIATTKKYTQNDVKKEKTLFIDFCVWGKSAEIFNQYTHKGSKILLEGELELQTWQDNSGNNRQKHFINVLNFVLLDNKAQSSSDQNLNNSSAPNFTPNQQNLEHFDDFDESTNDSKYYPNSDEIPF